jgi:hypothetical protein
VIGSVNKNLNGRKSETRQRRPGSSRSLSWGATILGLPVCLRNALARLMSKMVGRVSGKKTSYVVGNIMNSYRTFSKITSTYNDEPLNSEENDVEVCWIKIEKKNQSLKS